MKGIFERKPALPRHADTWDVSLIFNYIRAQGTVEEASLMGLTLRTTVLLALLTGQRRQTIYSLDIREEFMLRNGSEYKFILPHVQKHTRPGHHQKPLLLRAYQEDPLICIVKHLDQYIQRTSELRGSCTKLLTVTKPPYGPASLDTISRWLRTILTASGVPVKFSGHSTRSASTSAAASSGLIPTDIILRNAGWTSERTFAVFYQRDIVPDTTNSFSDAVYSQT
mgnify:CR=1 FL=1